MHLMTSLEDDNFSDDDDKEDPKMTKKEIDNLFFSYMRE